MLCVGIYANVMNMCGVMYVSAYGCFCVEWVGGCVYVCVLGC